MSFLSFTTLVSYEPVKLTCMAARRVRHLDRGSVTNPAAHEIEGSRSQGMRRFLAACLTLASVFAAGSTSASTLAITHVNVIDATGAPTQPERRRAQVETAIAAKMRMTRTSLMEPGCEADGIFRWRKK